MSISCTKSSKQNSSWIFSKNKFNNNDYIALNNDKVEQLPNLGIILKPMLLFFFKQKGFIAYLETFRTYLKS